MLDDGRLVAVRPILRHEAQRRAAAYATAVDRAAGAIKVHLLPWGRRAARRAGDR